MASSKSEDENLAALVELFEEEEPEVLISALRVAAGNVQVAVEWLLSGGKIDGRREGAGEGPTPTPPPLPPQPRSTLLLRASSLRKARARSASEGAADRNATAKRQRSIRNFFDSPKQSLVSRQTAAEPRSPREQNRLQPSPKDGSNNADGGPAGAEPGRKAINDVLKWKAGAEGRARNLPEKTLELFRPEDVAKHTPCELTFNVLPSELADALLVRMMDEAKAFKRRQWYLFENFVTSPHSTKFYATHFMAQDTVDDIYTGGGEVALFPPEMEVAKEIIAHIVNERMKSRKRSPLEVQDAWVPNVAAVNHYSNSKEAVGWHSDRLTNIGPMPTIASLNLGATRKFRLRKITPQGLGRIFTIEVPHNSLLIMNPPCQEEFRHDVPPVQSLAPHPISGSARINLTFRMYRDEYGYGVTPVCDCGEKSILRVVQKREATSGRYFYSCYAHARNQGKACSFFQWLDPIVGVARETEERVA